jgi:hypothetical protein
MSDEQINLGELIDLLKHRDPTQSVRFDFCGQAPRGISSYRGYYDHLAIEWGEYAEEQVDGKWQPKMTVAKFLEMLRGALGEKFCGWKGGYYEMSRHTPLWVANPGECDSTAVTGIAEENWWTVIETRYQP